jgi:ATP-dependent Clp protease ATP-binding subunit ClpB
MEAVRAALPARIPEPSGREIIFDRLNRADMDGIVDIQLARLEKRLAARKITLDLDARRQGLAGRRRAMTRSSAPGR